MSAESDASIVASTTSTINTAANAISQSNLNKRTQKWNEKQYDKARTDNLTDWNSQNKYNSPAEQMKRLRQAGLNPNLVYDNGASTISAQAVKSADTPSWNPTAPKYDFSSGISSYYDAQIKTATIDNLKQQNDNLQAEKILKEAQAINTNASTASTLQSTDASKFALGQTQRLADVSAQAAQANLNKTLVDTGTTIDANTRANMLVPGTIQNQIEDVLNKKQQNAKSQTEQDYIRHQIELLKVDKDLKELQYKQTKDNLSNTDPWYVKAVTKILAHYGITLDDLPPAPKNTKSIFNPFPATQEGERKKAAWNKYLNNK